MFEVYWNDTTQETVGQHKRKKKLMQGSECTSDGRPAKAATAKNNQSTTSFKRFSDITIDRDLPPQELSANNQLEPQELPAQMATGPLPKPYSLYTPYNDITESSSLFSEEPAPNSPAPTETVSPRSAARETPAQSPHIQSSSPKSFAIRRKPAPNSLSSSNKAGQKSHSASDIFTSKSDSLIKETNRISKTSLFSISSAVDTPLSEVSSPETLPMQVAASNALKQIAGASFGGEERTLNAGNQPQNRECTMEKVAISSQYQPISSSSDSGTPDTLSDGRNDPLPPNLVAMAQLQKKIRCMEAASQKIMLQRLQEDWADCPDAQVYEVMKNEKQWWFFTAIRALHKVTRPQEISLEKPKNSLQSDIRYGETRILSLHESYASAAFLCALSRTATTVCDHLCTIVPSEKLYSNIHSRAALQPLSKFPYPDNTFSSIYASSIPALLPSSSIPAILEECYRVLLPGKPLVVKILDPSPLSGTAGPYLQSWLNQNLLLGLEIQFRCLNPSRLFPFWLANAGLMAPSSTIATTRFAAVVDGQDTREELKAVVGRMLWKEIWGGFIKGAKWWWEYKQIVEECTHMRTVWEYLIIEAVKQY